MPQPIPKDRLPQLVECATRVFIEKGYRQTQMSDVASAMGVAKGSLYTYVEGKEILFDLVVRCADRNDWLATVQRPISKRPEATLEYIRQRLTQAETLTNLSEALAREHVTDSASELRGIVIEVYELLATNRYGIMLIDRSTREYPELAALWLDARSMLLGLLQNYLASRIASGHLLPVPDIAAATRLILETATFWAVLRHWDLRPEPTSDAAARDTVIHFVLSTLVPHNPKTHCL